MINHLCIYHADCFDGMTAGYLVKNKYAQCRMVAADYGEEFPFDLVNEDTVVIIVDFSYPAAVLQKIAGICRFLYVCDHHKSAIEDINDYIKVNGPLNDNIGLYLDTERSGARITFDEVINRGKRIQAPKIVEHTEDYDLWKFDLKNTHEVMAVLGAIPMTFKSWHTVARGLEVRYSQLLDHGKFLLMKDDRMIEWHIKNSVRTVNVMSSNVPFVNVPKYLVSKTLNAMVDKHAFVIGYHDTKNHRVLRFNSKKGGRDVSTIARQFGGGGHANSAGAKVTREHWIAQI